MSDVEKLIEQLELSVMGVGVETVIGARMQNTINFLRTLQPSDNGDLVKELKRWLKTPMPTTTTALHNEFHKVAGMVNNAIAALESPKSFDVLQHLRDGGAISLGLEPINYRVINGDLIKFKGDKQTQITCSSLLISQKDWQPYTEPEPTNAELIEDARIAVMDITADGTVLTRDRLDKIDIALDAFEKLTLETSSE